MWSTRHTYQRNKGFTLIEVILTFGVSSMVLLCLFSILDFSLKSSEMGDEKDEIMLHGRYALESIKNDVKSADIIISADLIKDLKTKYPDNIGFVILKIDDTRTPEGYNYITYHRNNHKLVRLACNTTNKKYPSYNDFKGNNEVCEFVNDISNTKLDVENSMVYLEFKFEHNSGHKLNLKSDIYIRCPIDY